MNTQLPQINIKATTVNRGNSRGLIEARLQDLAAMQETEETQREIEYLRDVLKRKYGVDLRTTENGTE